MTIQKEKEGGQRQKGFPIPNVSFAEPPRACLQRPQAVSSLWTQGRLVPAFPGPQPRPSGPLLPGWVSAEAHSSLGGQRAIFSETKEALGPERPSVSWWEQETPFSVPIPEPKRPPLQSGAPGGRREVWEQSTLGETCVVCDGTDGHVPFLWPGLWLPGSAETRFLLVR